MTRLLAVMALGGCLVTHVDGDSKSPSATPRLGEAHTCRVEMYCGAELANVFDSQACSDDTERLENEVAYACWEGHAKACGGFCYAECSGAVSACFFFDDP